MAVNYPEFIADMTPEEGVVVWFGYIGIILKAGEAVEAVEAAEAMLWSTITTGEISAQ